MSSRKRKKNTQRPAPRKTAKPMDKGTSPNDGASLKVVSADGGDAAQANVDAPQAIDSGTIAVSEISELRPHAEVPDATEECEEPETGEFSVDAAAESASRGETDTASPSPDGPAVSEGQPESEPADGGDVASQEAEASAASQLEHEAAPAPVVPASRTHLKRVLESLIFVSDQAISVQQLGRITKSKQAEVRELVAELAADYEGRGIELVELAGGYQFRSAAVCAPFVRDLVAQRPVRLTRAQLETLALVAYRQPITRPEVDDVRGVDSGSAIKVLLERDLIKILGRKDEAGRPLLYGTAPFFLEFFGMKGMQDLPTLREFTELNEENRELFRRKTGEVGDLSAEAETPLPHAASDAEQDAAEPTDVDELLGDDISSGGRVVAFTRGAGSGDADDDSPVALDDSVEGVDTNEGSESVAVTQDDARDQDDESDEDEAEDKDESDEAEDEAVARQRDDDESAEAEPNPSEVVEPDRDAESEVEASDRDDE